MKLATLIEAAAKKAGTARQLAKAMHTSPSRLSEWKNHSRKPDTSEVAYMAKVAGLPVLITVAMIEAELHPETRDLWETALGEIDAQLVGRVAPVRYKAITNNLAKLVSFWSSASPRLGFA